MAAPPHLHILRLELAKRNARGEGKLRQRELEKAKKIVKKDPFALT